MCKVCRAREKSEDSVGKTYNGIKVLEIVGREADGHARVRCLCPLCGKEWVANLHNIKCGYSKSCGCRLEKSEDSVGKIYNGVKVLEIVESEAYGRARVRCLCPLCGKDWIVRLKDIKSGNIRSCGCSRLKLEDSVGKIYNGIKVLEIVGKDARGNSKARCLCPFCGKEWVTNLTKIRIGLVKSCGCLRPKPEDSVGKIYNGIKILEIVGKNVHGHTLAKCLCPFCGKGWVTSLTKIRNGVIRSCGCNSNRGSNGQFKRRSKVN